MIGTWRIATWPERTADECWAQVIAFCQAKKLNIEEIDDIAISSVSPAVTAAFRRMSKDWLNLKEPFILKPEEYKHIKICYDPPRAVGADRICNAAAGFADFGGPLIIVDFGTATTFDVVDANGDYLGGAIMPGLETSASELYKKAARLFKVDLKFPDKVIGHTTESSLQSGILWGTIDAVDGLVGRIWGELGSPCKVIATGGLSPLLVKKSRTISETVPFLVLKGLNIIYNQMRK
jgi:type III pantothenate kinase